jgi:hypothetical protein
MIVGNKNPSRVPLARIEFILIICRFSGETSHLKRSHVGARPACHPATQTTQAQVHPIPVHAAKGAVTGRDSTIRKNEAFAVFSQYSVPLKPETAIL